MGQDDVFQAVKLPFSPQEYLCTWDIPDVRSENRDNDDSRRGGDENGTVELNGTLDLTTGHDPRGSFHRELPIVLEGDCDFPQTNDFKCLTGKLSVGVHFALINASSDYWHDCGYVDGTFAVLSGKPFKKDEHRTYRSIELQLEGLDRIIDTSPTETSVDRKSVV